MTLTLNFQGEIWNLLYLSQKWSDFHETKSKHIDRTLSLTCDHRVWNWPWPWPRIFKVKHGIGYISAKKWSRFPRNEKQTYRLGLKCNHWVWPWTWPWPWSWVFGVKYGIRYISTKSGPKVGCKDLPNSDRGDFRFGHADDSSIWPSS